MPEAIGVRAWAGAGYRVWRGLLRRCDSGGRVVLPRSKLEHVHHPGVHVWVQVRMRVRVLVQ